MPAFQSFVELCVVSICSTQNSKRSVFPRFVWWIGDDFWLNPGLAASVLGLPVLEVREKSGKPNTCFLSLKSVLGT